MRWSKPATPTTPVTPWPPHPPPGETELERAVRLEEEKEARRKSDVIDREIELERVEQRKHKNCTRVLLLGQAESGKSTMLKNFQLYFAPGAFHAEADAWRAVIHLNLVRSVNFILDLLPGGPSSLLFEASHPRHFSDKPLVDGGYLRHFRMRLSPLRQVELILVQRLSADDPSRAAANVEEAIPWYYGRASEVSIRGGSGWKALLRRKRNATQVGARPDDLDKARQILHACRQDIAELWEHADVQRGLEAEDVVLRDQSGFFLDEALRVASADYEPTPQDILRARLQTIGVEQHTISVERFGQPSHRWLFYDVGGAKGQRASWVPFFDDVDAILFLCPMSAFNEVLLEDRRMNRLLDSFNLWKTICMSRLLKGTTFILLLNKSDILQSKLEAGSYKDGPNDPDHVSEYLKRKFVAMCKHNSARERQLHVHVTCATDAIVVNNLRSSDYI
ncbi:guanine nucleotide binding protein, alpha subunit [Fomitopsis serialis]|uniref:guanine nucleotide binding protein, alpha subunit n=1 Tax=Fomitopsis serialis TaxID=139415 RepID=UPI002007202B|nr:guanine nucleotide binding protein, alpha subunit [Neoantrodia serialis]KAH9933905.1 guanine nucleotide binding protein, alpha subunit [Neoantrodia serialis]